MWARRDPQAIAVFARVREKFRSIPHRGGEAACEFYEALAAGFFGSAEQAITIGKHHLRRTTAAGAGITTAWAQMALAITLTKHGDVEEALKLGRAALAYLLPRGDQWGTIWAVHIRMWSLARLIADQSAACSTRRNTLVELASEIAYLGGGVKTQRARLGMLIEGLGPFSDETRSAEKIARDVLGQDAYTDVEKRGAQLFADRSELERVALGTLSIHTPSPAAKSKSIWQTLSAAEQEVAILAAAGWPNSAIGVRRGTTTKTTEAQMSSIFQKLLINSRDDIVRCVPQDQRNRVSAERAHMPRQSRDRPRSIHPRPQD
jgi:DNA-binding CsgD family transcriptional regulator